MLVRLSYLWEKLTSSYWLIPTLMLVGSLILSIVTISLDQRGELGVASRIGWIHSVGPSGARALLSVVASSMITVAGVVFSITVVVLTLASSQYGPRVLRNFFRDTTTSGVFGTFLATFLYCLLILRVIDDDGDMRVPYGSITVAVLFAVASLLVLVYFIHHISTSIQASTIVAGAYRELSASIERSFPSSEDNGHDEKLVPPPPTVGKEEDVGSVESVASGYILRVDDEGTIALARERDVVVTMTKRPGHFVVAGAELAEVSCADSVDDDTLQSVGRLFVIGPERTPHQDVLFAVRQLVEIAVRSLSPGVNDPFTAILCIDYLEAALCEASEREEPSSYHFDEDGRLRLIMQPVRFPELADAAWSDIRHHGANHPAVSRRLMESMALVALRAKTNDRAAVRGHAHSLLADSQRAISDETDLEAIENGYAEVEAAMEPRATRTA